MEETPTPQMLLLSSLMEMVETIGENEKVINTLKEQHPDLPGDVAGALDGCMNVMRSMGEIILQLNEKVFEFKDRLDEGEKRV